MDNLKQKVQVKLEVKRREQDFTDWLKDISPQNTWDIPHLVYMRTYIDRIIDGEPLQLMFLAPPRHGKSEQNTRHLAAFYPYKFPKKQVIIAAHTQSLANDFSRDARMIALNCMDLAGDKLAVTDWKTEENGGVKAIGVGGGIAGRGGDLIIIDDPIKNREEAYSKVYRDKVWKWYTVDLYSRREPKASIILTMTPWHYDDLAHRILNSKDAKNWIVVKMPAIAKDNDVLGRTKGDALWPDRYSVDDLLKIKATMGDDFEALYQLNPVVAEGNIIKRDWFVQKPQSEFPIRWDFIGQYYDTAFKKGQRNDYNVCLTFGKVGTQFYILDIFRKKLEFPELKEASINLAQTYKPYYIGIEDKASGQSLLQELGRSNLPIKPEAIKVTDDKESRAHAVTPFMRDKKIILPKGALWVDDFLDEVCMFPSAPHDDQVDTFTMALNHQRNSGYNLEAIIGGQ